MLLSGNLHLLSLPKSMHALVVHLPTGRHDRLMDTGSTEARPKPGNLPHLAQKLCFVSRTPGLISLGAAWLAQHATDAAFRNVLWPQATTDFVDRSSPTLGADQFPFAASLRISMSKACSATSFFSRAFSCRTAFSSLAISGCIPPYF